MSQLTSAPASSTKVPTSARSDNGFRHFLVEYRVVISSVIFATLIIGHVCFGTRPRSWWIGGDPLGIAGAALAVVGLLIRSWAAGVLRKGKTLAVVGPYSLCRHPLYLGSFCMMLGFCMILGNPIHWIIVCGPIAAIYWATMQSEEKKMMGRFGESWRTYLAVPRLIPWRWSGYVSAAFEFGQWYRNHEWRAVVATIGGLVALQAWHGF